MEDTMNRNSRSVFYVLLMFLGVLFLNCTLAKADDQSIWDHKALTYRIVGCPDKLNCSVAYDWTRKAVQIWDANTGLSFREVTSGEDITIRFSATNADGLDWYCFKNFGGSIFTICTNQQGATHPGWPGAGQAHYPADGGDVWINRTMNFVVTPPTKPYDEEVYLPPLILHEIGHALGLAHDPDHIDSLMWSTFMLTAGNQFELDQWTLARIQALYGENTPVTP
jgi:predicted Zn-dependent protease